MKWVLRAALLRAPQRSEAWLDRLYARHSLQAVPGATAVDLGSGSRPRNPFQAGTVRGADLEASAGVDACDLAGGCLPYPSNSIDCFTAFDVFEHIPRVWPMATDGRQSVAITRFPFVGLMSGLHDALKPGGMVFAKYPAYPWAIAFQDPTHVNIMTEETMAAYFCGTSPWAHIYGFSGRFELIDQGWVESHHVVLLSKPVG